MLTDQQHLISTLMDPMQLDSVEFNDLDDILNQQNHLLDFSELDDQLWMTDFDTHITPATDSTIVHYDHVDHLFNSKQESNCQTNEDIETVVVRQKRPASVDQGSSRDSFSGSENSDISGCSTKRYIGNNDVQSLTPLDTTSSSLIIDSINQTNSHKTQNAKKYPKILPQPSLPVIGQQPVTLILQPNLTSTGAMLLPTMYASPSSPPSSSSSSSSSSTSLSLANASTASAATSSQPPPLPPRSSCPQMNQSMSTIANKLQQSHQVKQARMQRNREAALQSRKKKKEYMEGLERNLSKLNKENLCLKQENERLQQELRTTKQENELLKQKFGIPLTYETTVSKGILGKKTISLLAVFFLLGLNIGPFADQMINNEPIRRPSISRLPDSSSDKLLEQAGHHTGRTLLWAESNNLRLLDTPVMNSSVMINSSSDKSYQERSFKCQPAKGLNQTDSLRLDREMRSWARLKLNKPEVNNHRLQAQRRLRNWLHNGFNVHLFASNSPLNTPVDFDVHKSIRPRQDTYYLVYLQHPDQVLLPINPPPNQTQPVGNGSKFSLLFPAFHSNIVSPNAAGARNRTLRSARFRMQQPQTLLQIDCQVSNLRFIRLHDLATNGEPVPVFNHPTTDTQHHHHQHPNSLRHNKNRNTSTLLSKPTTHMTPSKDGNRTL